MRKPDFLLIGSQKSGTSWMWRMLESHPGVQLPAIKEIHFFGGIENYRKGASWYYNFFSNIGKDKITGEASTSYFFDRMPYWNNSSYQIEYDNSIPVIPEVIYNEIPDAKIIVILRDPIKRAISAYQHTLREIAKNRGVVRERATVFWSLKRMALEAPRRRILEYGYYSKYLTAWYDIFPSEQIKVFIFEDDILKNPDKTISDLYQFLNLDNNNDISSHIMRKYNVSWGYFSILLTYLMPKNMKHFGFNRLTKAVDQTFFSKKISNLLVDIDFLREKYKGEKEKVENILNRKISW